MALMMLGRQMHTAKPLVPESGFLRFRLVLNIWKDKITTFWSHSSGIDPSRR